jgi:hypothetical protein
MHPAIRAGRPPGFPRLAAGSEVIDLGHRSRIATHRPNQDTLITRAEHLKQSVFGHLSMVTRYLTQFSNVTGPIIGNRHFQKSTRNGVLFSQGPCWSLVAGFGYIKPIGPSIVHALLAGVLLSFESAAARSHDAGFGLWFVVHFVLYLGVGKDCI